MTITDRNGKRGRSRDGIALVVVLGMLAMMTLLATAFVYFMRTENTIANYYRMDISSRHVLNVALARVLMDLNTELKNEVYPDWQGQANVKTSPVDPSDPPMLPPQEEFGDAMAKAVSNMPAGAFVALGVHEGIPRDMLNTTGPAFADGNINYVVVNLTQNSAGWIESISGSLVPVRNKGGRINWVAGDRFAKIPLPSWDFVEVDDMTSFSAKSDKRVRYAYAVFNCSGLLDANYVGASNAVRQLGTGYNEIQLDALVGRDFIDTGAVDLFLDERKDFGVKYESIQELFEQNKGFDYWPENFAVYSRFPWGQYAPSNALALTGGVNWVQTQAVAFRNKLIASDPGRFNGTNSQWVFDSLMDYLDQNSVPTNMQAMPPYGGPSMELCPMINEIGITNYLTLKPDGTLTHTMLPYVEVCYPFLELPVVNNYRLEVELQYFNPYGKTDSRFVPTPTTITYFRTLPAMSLGVKYRSINLGFHISPPITYTNNALVDLDKPNLRLLVIVKRAQIFDSANRLVDAVPFPINQAGSQLFFSVPFQEPDGYVLPTTAVATTNTVNLGWGGMECVDPRFNWRRVSAVDVSDFYWKTYRPSNTTAILADRTQPSMTLTLVGPSFVNNCTTSYWATSGCSDPFDEMHVPFPTNNNRSLQSISELGYLPVGKWDTIRLVGGVNYPADKIFESFTLATNAVARAKINPNTYDPDVLAAAFYNMPLDRFPFQNTATVARLSLDDARALAILWTNAVVQKPIANYTDLIGHVTNMMDTFPYANNLFATTNHSVPFRNESLLRNTVGLFDARQNYFFIVMVAAEITKGFDNVDVQLKNQVFSFNSRSALIEIWRDPYVVNGQNATILRNYRLLDD